MAALGPDGAGRLRDHLAASLVLPPGWRRLQPTPPGACLVARPEQWSGTYGPFMALATFVPPLPGDALAAARAWVASRQSQIRRMAASAVIIDAVEEEAESWLIVAHDHPAGGATTVQRYRIQPIDDGGALGVLFGWASAIDPDWPAVGEGLGFALATATLVPAPAQPDPAAGTTAGTTGDGPAATSHGGGRRPPVRIELTDDQLDALAGAPIPGDDEQATSVAHALGLTHGGAEVRRAAAVAHACAHPTLSLAVHRQSGGGFDIARIRMSPGGLVVRPFPELARPADASGRSTGAAGAGAVVCWVQDRPGAIGRLLAELIGLGDQATGGTESPGDDAGQNMDRGTRYSIQVWSGGWQTLLLVLAGERGGWEMARRTDVGGPLALVPSSSTQLWAELCLLTRRLEPRLRSRRDP